MPTEMGAETVEIITMAVDKFQSTKNYEVNEIILVLLAQSTKYTLTK